MADEKLSKEDIKQIELEILIAFSEACRQHGLKLYVSGGTLLGAVRHKGFIPWDDDIDVCMPRPDYMRMQELAQTGGFMPERYGIISYERGDFPLPFCKIIDTTTSVETKYMSIPEASSLWIDVIPVDGLPSSEHERDRLYDKVQRIRLILMTAYAKWGTGTTLYYRAAKLLLIPISRLIGKKRCGYWIWKTATKNSYEASDMVGAVTWGLYGRGEAMKKTEFEKPVPVEFEGNTFETMSCWDSYLHNLYGDYMTLPPENKRTTHEMNAWRCGA